MAAPLQPGKQSVDLAAGVAPGSRIRRDPKPIEKQTIVPDRDERDQKAVILGVAVFALALMVVIAGVSMAAGWTPRDYVLHF